jgi:2-oxoglutarate dehydrogenase E2 component (dihydrolipoamide succinyltransferase)
MEVKVPSLGESITSGILATWHVNSGDYVEPGQAIYDLETDKITSEGTAEAAGVIDLKVDEGDEVDIGGIIAVIDTDAEKPEGTGDEADKVVDEGGKQAPTKPAAGTHPPSVRRIAAESGLNPDGIEGSGKAGRVTKGDMLEAVRGKEAKESPVADIAVPSSNQTARRSSRKMSPLRRTIANRLVEAQQSTAMLTTFNEVDMSRVMELRKLHQEKFVARYGVKRGFMSFFTKAVVHALKEIPAVNSQVDGNNIVTNHYYDIGVAVSTQKGLMVPVLRDCDQKSFAEVEKDLIGYANRAKEGKIGIDDLQGGVFTISNGGIFGSMLSTPILNSPQSAILGMHTIQQRPVAIDGEVVIRPMMYLALSYDHRIIDGREAVGFLVCVKNVIEDPARLLFEI